MPGVWMMWGTVECNEGVMASSSFDLPVLYLGHLREAPSPLLLHSPQVAPFAGMAHPPSPQAVQSKKQVNLENAFLPHVRVRLIFYKLYLAQRSFLLSLNPRVYSSRK